MPDLRSIEPEGVKVPPTQGDEVYQASPVKDINTTESGMLSTLSSTLDETMTSQTLAYGSYLASFASPTLSAPGTNTTSPLAGPLRDAIQDPKNNAAIIDLYANTLELSAAGIDIALKDGASAFAPSDRAYLEAITRTFRELKTALFNMQKEDTALSRELVEIKLAQVERLTEQIAEQKVKAEEERAAQEEAASTNEIMKWVGVGLFGASLIAGIGSMIFSFGATSGGVAAFMAVNGPTLIGMGVATAAVVTFTVLDDEFGLTATMLEGLDELLDKMEIADHKLKTLVKAIIKAVITSVVVGAFVLAASYSPGSGATMLNQVLSKVMSQLAMQAAMLTLMKSKALPELVTANLKMANVDEETLKIIEIFVTVIQMLALMMIVAKVSLKDSSKDVAQSLADRVANFDPKKWLESFITVIKNIPTNLRNMPSSMLEKLMDFPRLLQANKVQLLFKVVQLAPQIGQVVAGTLQAQVYFELADITEATGKIAESQQYKEALIKILENIMADLQKSRQSSAGMMGDADRTFTELMAAYGRSANVNLSA